MFCVCHTSPSPLARVHVNVYYYMETTKEACLLPLQYNCLLQGLYLITCCPGPLARGKAPSFDDILTQYKAIMMTLFGAYARCFTHHLLHTATPWFSSGTHCTWSRLLSCKMLSDLTKIKHHYRTMYMYISVIWVAYLKQFTALVRSFPYVTSLDSLWCVYSYLLCCGHVSIRIRGAVVVLVIMRAVLTPCPRSLFLREIRHEAGCI